MGDDEVKKRKANKGIIKKDRKNETRFFFLHFLVYTYEIIPYC